MLKNEFKNQLHQLSESMKELMVQSAQGSKIHFHLNETVEAQLTPGARDLHVDKFHAEFSAIDDEGSLIWQANLDTTDFNWSELKGNGPVPVLDLSDLVRMDSQLEDALIDHLQHQNAPLQADGVADMKTMFELELTLHGKEQPSLEALTVSIDVHQPQSSEGIHFDYVHTDPLHTE